MINIICNSGSIIYNCYYITSKTITNALRVVILFSSNSSICCSNISIYCSNVCDGSCISNGSYVGNVRDIILLWYYRYCTVMENVLKSYNRKEILR